MPANTMREPSDLGANGRQILASWLRSALRAFGFLAVQFPGVNTPGRGSVSPPGLRFCSFAKIHHGLTRLCVVLVLRSWRFPLRLNPATSESRYVWIPRCLNSI